MKTFITILALVLLTSCSLHVDQRVEGCDETRFQVTTWATTFGTRNSKYWRTADCVTAEQVDSTKKAEREKAERFIENYKKLSH